MEVNEMDNEIWKKITYPRVKRNMYIVSNLGNVKNIISNKTLRQYRDKDGYLRVYLTIQTDTGERKARSIFAHRLVAYEFVENPNNYPVIDHLNGIKDDNRSSNLEWVTVKENTHRAEKMGFRKIKGGDNGNSKYSEEFVRSICEKFELGWSRKDVYHWIMKDDEASSIENTKLYNLLLRLKSKTAWEPIVSQYNYDSSINMMTWRAIKPETGDYTHSEEDIRYICEQLQAGKKVMEIVDELQKTSPLKRRSLRSHVDMIRLRRKWHNITKDYTWDIENAISRKKGCPEDIADLCDEGYKYKEICKILGIEKDTESAHELKLAINRYNKMKKLSNNETIMVMT